MTRTAKSLLTLSAAMLVAAALTGCTPISDALSKQERADYTTYEDAAKGWPADGGIPDWIPADASDLHLLRTTDGSNEIVEVTSADDLGTVGCDLHPRRNMPGLTAEWDPGTYPDTVRVCDDWEIAATEEGWFGWRIAGTPIG